MNFHILTLFPEMVMQGLMTSITGRAVKQNKIQIETVNIRDYTADKHKKVDDYPYGGGAGMLMQAQPVYDAYRSVADRLSENAKKRVVYVTPQGTPFTQQMAQDFAGQDDLILLCGHYEGIDERVLEEIVTDYVSIGDYVLTGGELASMVIVDAVARLVPDVLNNEQSAETESFHGNLLEYPQYSRPEVWHEKAVPEVLLSGNQKKIESWRREQAVIRTRERRPDLYEKYDRLQQCIQILMKQKLLHMDMIELIRRGRARLVYQQEGEILLKDMVTGIYFHTRMQQLTDFKDWKLLEYLKAHDENIACMVTHQEDMVDAIRTELGLSVSEECWQVVYTKREKMPVRGLYGPNGIRKEDGLCIRLMDETSQDFVIEHYEIGDGSYVRSRIRNKAVYGAFYGEEIVGFAGQHEEGSLGMLFVLPEYRSRRVAAALETYMINLSVERGEVPYGHVIIGNTASEKMQENLGLCKAKGKVYWMSKKS